MTCTIFLKNLFVKAKLILITLRHIINVEINNRQESIHDEKEVELNTDKTVKPDFEYDMITVRAKTADALEVTKEAPF